MFFFACPSHALRNTCRQLKENLSEATRFIGAMALCKGLEPGSNLFAHEVMSEELGSDYSCGYLAGPSHAEDIAEGKPAAMVFVDKMEPERKGKNYKLKSVHPVCEFMDLMI